MSPPWGVGERHRVSTPGDPASSTDPQSCFQPTDQSRASPFLTCRRRRPHGVPGDAALAAPRDLPRARRQETELPKSPESQAGGEEEEEKEEAEGSQGGTRRSSATPKGLHTWMHKQGFAAASQLLLDPAGCRHRC